MKKLSLLRFVILLCSLSSVITLRAQQHQPVSVYNVVWDKLGTDENCSMPLGNGDVALNVWTEQNGDIVLLLAKSDAWNENAQLLKLGRVRVSLKPNPFVGALAFTQKLRLETGEFVLTSGHNTLTVRVDANHPVIKVNVRTENPVIMKATSEIWRSHRHQLNQYQVCASDLGFWDWNSIPSGMTFDPDTVLASQKNAVTWCHFNARSVFPLVLEREHLSSLVSKYPDPLMHRCFGVMMQGRGLVKEGSLSLVSAKATTSQRLDMYALTEQASSVDVWTKDLRHVASAIEKEGDRKLSAAHLQWWNDFWNRSWIQVSGSDDAGKVAQSYAIMRYMTACAGRGAQPIKFNGSLFTVGHDMPDDSLSKASSHIADFRRWGPCYWNQNTRHIYWPLLATGDDDMLMPWFNMYTKALPLAKEKTRMYYHHDGASFIETMYFWGLPCLTDFGWENKGFDPQSSYMRYHIQGGLEVAMMMLDYYEYTQDEKFARESMIPFADAIVTYYDQHWERDMQGRIHINPGQSLETYQMNAENPTPDVAGLWAVLPRLLNLPDNLASEQQRAAWKKEYEKFPSIPVGLSRNNSLPANGIGELSGKMLILPAERYGKSRNIENPELYTVFPYRLFGIGKPNLELARNTFSARLFHINKCWGQDGQHAASLGLTNEAQKTVVKAFTCYGNQQFKWFWAQNYDYSPDMDNGGCGMTTLELMLMQCDGKRIILLPAWPKEWTADFKLHAMYNTTVEGHVENGKISNMKVVPQERAKDVTVMQ